MKGGKQADNNEAKVVFEKSFCLDLLISLAETCTFSFAYNHMPRSRYSEQKLIRTEKILVRTKGENDTVNVTNLVQDKIAKSKAKDGFMILFLQSTTSALTVMEFEDGLRIDIPRAMSKIVPKSIEYEHEKAYHDGNGHSHVKSSMIGVDLVLPFKDRELLLGTWQQIAVMEFDVRPRERTLIVQIVTE